ncbi:hypothetical protein, partial [Bradyrhizobium algeriense]|uniref:hypothetical protein n=1 Tax=Bradyrhizobium algeriense TaxID=634784 RepID=UPI001AEC838F
LISMMARSTTRSNQRPDTLMQDRICQVDETSCNARPDHTFGSWGRHPKTFTPGDILGSVSFDAEDVIILEHEGRPARSF